MRDRDVIPELCEHCQRAVVLVSRRRGEAVRDFTLQRENHRARLVRALDQAFENWRGDAVREVGNDLVGQRDVKIRLLQHFHGIAFDQCHAVQVIAQILAEPSVLLDGDHPFGARHQLHGQRSQPRSDLQHGFITTKIRLFDKNPQDIAVDEKVLPECLARTDVEFGKQLTDLRERHFVVANCAAMLIAAIIPSGRATPLPAMSGAVPWSGDVRMNGSPSVRFTPLSKAINLNGASPWS